jgi:hypothetical protein
MGVSGSRMDEESMKYFRRLLRYGAVLDLSFLL